MKPARTKLLAIEAEMNNGFVARREEIRGLLWATLSGQHILFLGPPGNAKTQLVTTYSEYLSAARFSWLLTKFSTPDEIFGPVDIASMKSGVFKRIITDKLPTAEVAFLDEVFKGNSPILNSMLSVLQERVFFNNGVPIKCPLIFAVGASNELPDKDEGLSALYDRFLIRFNTGYLEQAEQIEELLTLPAFSRHVDPLEREDLVLAQQTVKDMPLSDEGKESLMLLWQMLREEGIIVSDRRLKQALQVMAAESYLSDADEITANSLIVAEHLMWDDPDKIRTVKQIVRQCVDPTGAKAQDIWAAAQEAIATINVDETLTRDELIQVAQQLNQMNIELKGMKQTAKVEDIATNISATRDDLMTRILQGDGLQGIKMDELPS
jgi:MoxR-like ATPase